MADGNCGMIPSQQVGHWGTNYFTSTQHHSARSLDWYTWQHIKILGSNFHPRVTVRCAVYVKITSHSILLVY